MSLNSRDGGDARLDYLHDVELSERELFYIGQIIAQWGALEYEIFCQTLQTFDGCVKSLPKEMNNMQFSGVLEKWRERVVDRCIGEKKKKLDEQYDLIRHYQDYRDALVHGMWDWDISSPHKIKTTRVRKKEVRSVHFTAADLQDFSLEVARINFNVRYPRGVEDLAEMAKKGGHISRLGMSMLSGNPVAAELAPSLKLTGKQTGKAFEDN